MEVIHIDERGKEMSKLWIVFVVCSVLAGCGRCEMRCIDGHVYQQQGSIWVQDRAKRECRS